MASKRSDGAGSVVQAAAASPSASSPASSPDSSSAESAPVPAASAPAPVAVKLLVAGGFGVGKTTLVGAVSEIRPLQTEELLTDRGVHVDDTGGVERKTTTTVAMDFGRITIRAGLVLYLFGTPGQDRFWFMWDELSYGALGAVVLADTRRLTDSFAAVDYFENRGLPFVVAVNRFEDGYDYTADEIREALDLGEGPPVVLCDARDRASGKEVLTTLMKHILAVHRARRRSSAPAL
ncbi:ATP-binding protein [Actinomadura sp. KC06]|uniref:GTP-binding protein n=1 Tax=Actinomadura sp. KC06 TaxID=2530369 RepID=UPI00104565B1|nr:ATP/GTP-binding protein [Actinomadura sp. KC06]TDD35080.1 ATP-binding protein [Actinomadura sp. KC06]